MQVPKAAVYTQQEAVVQAADKWPHLTSHVHFQAVRVLLITHAKVRTVFKIVTVVFPVQVHVSRLQINVLRTLTTVLEMAVHTQLM